jgi:hypothetical protein
MRLPTLEKDFWALISGEVRHAESPQSFWIPELTKRESLTVGQAAKLIFEIESEDENGEVERNTERMWVVVSEVVPPYFIGRLTNRPASAEESEDFYLVEGVEVPFLPEHVIDIDDPPHDFLRELFSESPKGVWPRE